eukprot:2408392-Rhodomonas_salina.1
MPIVSPNHSIVPYLPITLPPFTLSSHHPPLPPTLSSYHPILPPYPVLLPPYRISLPYPPNHATVSHYCILSPYGIVLSPYASSIRSVRMGGLGAGGDWGCWALSP